MNDEDFEFSWDFGERQELKKALKEISDTCPILFPDKNRKTHLFEESTKRRQEIAKKVLKNT